MNRRLKFLLLALSPVAILAIAALYVVQAGVAAQAEFDARVAALKAAGEPTSIKDLARKPPLPQENAATYLRRASDAMESIDKEYTAAYENLTPEQQEAADFDRPPAVFVASLREALNAYPEAMNLIEEAVAAPYYDSQLDYSADPAAFWDELEKQSYRVNRRAMRMLNYRASIQLADGDAEGALQTTLKMLKLCRHFDKDPTLLGGLVAIACRGVALGTADLALRAGPISEPLREELDEELARSDIPRVYRDSLLSDRAFGLDALRALQAMQLAVGADDERWFLKLAAAFANNQEKYFDYMAHAIALAGRPYADLTADARLNELVAEVDPTAKVVMPSIRGAQAAACRCVVYIRSVQILNAIQRYERDHPGKEPTVADLKLPAEVTTDPFNNQPLHVVKLPQGWSIYSVDMDLKDDGGRESPPDSGLLINRITAEAEAEQ